MKRTKKSGKKNDEEKSDEENVDNEIAAGCIPTGKYNKNRALFIAAKNNHYDLVKYLVENGATNLKKGYEGAAICGSVKLAELFESLLVKKGEETTLFLYDYIWYYAAFHNHKEFINYLISKKHSYRIDYGLEGATAANNTELTKFLIKYKTGKIYISDTLRRATTNIAKHNNKSLIEDFIQNNLLCYETIMPYIVENESIESVKEMVECALDFYKRAYDKDSFGNYSKNQMCEMGMLKAVDINCKELIEYFISIGNPCLTMGLYHATLNQNLDLMKYFVSIGAKEFKWMYKTATKQKSRKDIIDYVTMLIKDPDSKLNHKL